MKLPRAIRLDPSDAFVFDRAAEADQWVVSGAFLFDPATELTPKQRVALRSGLLGIEDFGWTTLAVAVPASEAEVEAATQTLARAFVERLGAPLQAARDEIAFAASLADHPEGTLIAVRREIVEREIVERFRTLRRREATPAAPLSPERVFQFVESDEPDETVDLAALLAQKSPP
jgi:hypothetical protein